MANYKKYLGLITAIFLLKFILIAIYTFHYPSEARYASIAMRMALNDNYLMPFFAPDVPFLGKPPLAFWASALSFKIFGFSEFAGRLPHLLVMLALCLFLYRAVKKLYNQEIAIYSAIILLSCPLFITLHSVMTESFLLLAMAIISLSFLVQIESAKKNIYGYLFFIGCAAALLTKGPVGIVMPCLGIFIYLIISKRWQELWQKFPIISGSIIFLTISLPWFILAEISYPGFLQYFIIGENFNRFATAGWQGDKYGHAHKVFFGAIWPFLLISTLPISLALLAKSSKVYAIISQKIKRDQKLLFLCLSFIAPMIFLTFMRNMIMTYAIYALTPFVIICAYVIAEKRWDKLIKFLLYFTLIIHIIALIIFTINPPIIAEKLNYQTFLFKEIPLQDRANKDFQLYYLKDGRKIFPLYWHSKDKVINLSMENFMQIKNSGKKQYVIGSIFAHEWLPEKYQNDLRKIICTKNQEMCLYAINDE